MGASFGDPQTLAWICRFMVDAQCLSTALDTDDRTRVTSISNVERGLILVHGPLIIRYHEYDVSCAAF